MMSPPPPQLHMASGSNVGPRLRFVTPVFIYNESAAVKCYRIPSVIQTHSGVLIALAEARHGRRCGDHTAVEIAQRVSRDGGQSWGPVELILGNASHPLGNPCLVQAANGILVLVLARHDSTHLGDAVAANVVCTSNDDGRTWSEPQDISTEPWPPGRSGPGLALQLRHHAFKDRILTPISIGSHFNTSTYIARSDDAGRTWRVSQTLLGRAFFSRMGHNATNVCSLPATVEEIARPGSCYPGFDETQLAERADGSVVLLVRHMMEPSWGRMLVVSEDGGNSFGKLSFVSSIATSIVMGSLVSMEPRSSAMLYSGPASRSRSNLSLWSTQDGGTTWSGPRLLNPGPSGNSGYSVLVRGYLRHSKCGARRKECIGVLYESGILSLSEEGVHCRYCVVFERVPR